MSNEVEVPAILRADVDAAFQNVLRGVFRAAFRAGISWARVKALAEEAANQELAREAAYGDRMQKEVAAELGTTPRTLQRQEPQVRVEREGLRRDYQRRLFDALARVSHPLTALEAAAVVTNAEARFSGEEWTMEAPQLLDELVARGAVHREQRHVRLAPVYSVDRARPSGTVKVGSAVEFVERLVENVSRFAEVAASAAAWARAANVGRRGPPLLPDHLRVTNLDVDVDPSIPRATILEAARNGVLAAINQLYRAPADGDRRRARVRLSFALTHLQEDLSDDPS